MKNQEKSAQPERRSQSDAEIKWPSGRDDSGCEQPMILLPSIENSWPVIGSLETLVMCRTIIGQPWAGVPDPAQQDRATEDVLRLDSHPTGSPLLDSPICPSQVPWKILRVILTEDRPWTYSHYAATIMQSIPAEKSGAKRVDTNSGTHQ